jgi:hypothetical protein
MIYPHQNIFNSSDWNSRKNLLSKELPFPGFYTEKYKGISLGFQNEGLISDFESIPFLDKNELDRHFVSQQKARPDWMVFRKISDPSESLAKRLNGEYLPYSDSPWIDLTRDDQIIKKEAISHIGRTERKLTRELGKPELVQYDDMNKGFWFETFTQFQRALGRLNDHQVEILKNWILNAPLDPWMRLISLNVGETVLAIGLFYSQCNESCRKFTKIRPRQAHCSKID